jgi:hypothetical protein
MKPGLLLLLLSMAARAIAVFPADKSNAKTELEQTYYFYHGNSYGSQGNFNPANVIINGGYGIWQVYPHVLDRNLLKAPYRSWWGNTWDDIRNPVSTVKQFGLKKFLTTEIFPLSGDINQSQFIPNYFLHGIGAGMLSRETEEWYGWHGFKNARLLSFFSMYAYHLLSEVVENKGSTKLSVDAVADLYVFDLGGILLFYNEGVCRFFSHKLGLSEWSLQPAYNWKTGQLENMGQFYVMRYPQRSGPGWSLFVHYGLHGMVGLSRKDKRGHSISFAAGLMVENLREVDSTAPGLVKTADITWSGGVFYDINNSAMFSATFSGYRHNRLKINLYPGLVEWKGLSPGLFICNNGSWVTGISLMRFPLGAATSSGH